MNAEQMAAMFTQLGISDCLKGYLNQLVEISGLDRLHGDSGREARDASRTKLQLQVEIAEHALQLRKDAGKR